MSSDLSTTVLAASVSTITAVVVFIAERWTSANRNSRELLRQEFERILAVARDFVVETIRAGKRPNASAYNVLIIPSIVLRLNNAGREADLPLWIDMVVTRMQALADAQVRTDNEREHRDLQLIQSLELLQRALLAAYAHRLHPAALDDSFLAMINEAPEREIVLMPDEKAWWDQPAPSWLSSISPSRRRQVSTGVALRNLRTFRGGLHPRRKALALQRLREADDTLRAVIAERDELVLEYRRLLAENEAIGKEDLHPGSGDAVPD